MCNYHTWFHDDKSGYVVECRHCNKIQVCFGNLLLSFDADSFDRFRRYVENNFEKISPDKDRYIKSIVLSTACNKTNMILSEAEFHGLYHMMEYADTEMRTAGLMKLFNVVNE